MYLEVALDQISSDTRLAIPCSSTSSLRAALSSSRPDAPPNLHACIRDCLLESLDLVHWHLRPLTACRKRDDMPDGSEKLVWYAYGNWDGNAYMPFPDVMFLQAISWRPHIVGTLQCTRECKTNGL